MNVAKVAFIGIDQNESEEFFMSEKYYKDLSHLTKIMNHDKDVLFAEIANVLMGILNGEITPNNSDFDEITGRLGRHLQVVRQNQRYYDEEIAKIIEENNRMLKTLTTITGWDVSPK